MSEGLFTALELTGGPVRRGLKRLFLEMSVGIAVRRKLHRAGYTVYSRPLRQVMYEPGFRERLAQQSRDDDELNRSLAHVIASPTPESVAVLRRALTTAFRLRLDGSTASTEFREERAEARHAEVLSAVAGTDEMTWESRLAAMPPLRAEDLRDVRTQWPGIVRVVADLATSADRDALLRRWAAYPPRFLADAPASVFGVLADIAGDQMSPEVQQAANLFTEVGLERGLGPPGYWMLRLMSGRGITDINEAKRFLRDARGYPLVEAALHEDGVERAIETLEQWDPPSRREDLHRRLSLADLYLSSRRIDDGVALARETARLYESTSAAMVAVRALLARQMIEPSAAHAADLSTALLMVMDARARRRQWGLESGSALALEVRVRRALTDRQGVFDLVNGTGELPATAEEFQHPDVIAEAALLHAELGDVEVARRLLSTAAASKRDHIAAVIAERESRKDDAVRHWLAAINAADDWGEKADLSLRLAFQGVRAGFVDELGPENAEAAAELGMIAALFAEQPGALEAFRGFANATYRGTLFLYTYFRERGDLAAAAALARDGATRWGDPDLWVEAAKHRMGEGEHADAIAELQSALSAATDAWGGRSTAYRYLVEAYSANGNWSAALVAAGRLLADEPGNPSAAWAVIVCQVRTHDPTGALRTWREQGGPEPQTEYEVAAWIELVSEFGPDVGTPQDALRIAARFPTDESIRGALLGAFFFGRWQGEDVAAVDGDGEEGPDPDRDAFRAMLSDYLRDFPDGAIRQVSVDMENPLQSMQDLVGERPRNVELEQQVLQGVVPLGFAGLLYGRSYLETLVARNEGPVFSASRNLEAEKIAIAHAHSAGVVIDLSALVTLARLPAAIRPQLVGHFANARVLREHQNDAAPAARFQQRSSGMTYRPGVGGEAGSVELQSEEEVVAQAELADRVNASFVEFAIDSHPVITAFDEVTDLDFKQTFLLGADRALGSELAFWVDDLAMKELLRQQGGHAFGTPELMVHLRDEGMIDEELIDLAEAHLVASGYTGVRFRRPVWDLAAGFSASSAGLANAIRYAGVDNVGERAEFASAMITSHVEDPGMLAMYVHAMAEWLTSIAANEQTAVRNLQLLSGDLLRRTWMSSSILPYCVNALRATSGQVDAPSILLSGVFRYYQALAETRGQEEAAVVAFDLISRLDPPDAYRVRAAILSGAFD